MANMDQFKKLPSLLQTETNKKFFDATIEQLFSKKESKTINGFIGRRESGFFDPNADYYLETDSKDRKWYQLEPTAVSFNEDTLEQSNELFYYDLINKINYYGGNVANHDRLFSGKYYSFAPPIDVDKFTNYQNYYWVYDKLPVLDVVGVKDQEIKNDIIGNENYMFEFTTIEGEVVEVNMSSGMRVNFVDSEFFNEPLTVEGVGNAIQLVKDYDSREFLTENNEIAADYITIARGAFNRNDWSVTNKWYHKDLVSISSTLSNEDAYDNAVQAQRPIIEFNANIELYGGERKFLQNVNYASDSTTYNDIVNRGVTIVDGELITDGDRLIFLNDQTDVEVNSGAETFIANQTPFDFKLSNDISDSDHITVVVTRPSLDNGTIVYDNNIYNKERWYAIEDDKRTLSFKIQTPGLIRNNDLVKTTIDGNSSELAYVHDLSDTIRILSNHYKNDSNMSIEELNTLIETIILDSIKHNGLDVFVNDDLQINNFTTDVSNLLVDVTKLDDDEYFGNQVSIVFESVGIVTDGDQVHIQVNDDEEGLIGVEEPLKGGEANGDRVSIFINSLYTIESTGDLSYDLRSGIDKTISVSVVRDPYGNDTEVVQYTKDVDYTYNDDTGALEFNPGSVPENGDMILVKYDLAEESKFRVSRYIWEVRATTVITYLTDGTPVETEKLTLWPIPDEFTPVNKGESVYVMSGQKYADTKMVFDGIRWNAELNKKYTLNQPPLFELYYTELDNNGSPISLRDFEESTFNGCEIFSYKVNTGSRQIDPVINIPLEYKNLGQIADIVFEHDLHNDTFYYNNNDVETEIKKYYYYNDIKLSDDGNTVNNFSHTWHQVEGDTKQRVHKKWIISDVAEREYALDIEPNVLDNGEHDIVVVMNDTTLYEGDDYRIDESTNSIIMLETVKLTESEVIESSTYSDNALSDDSEWFYEIPTQLESNPNNEEIYEYSSNELTKHFVSIIDGQTGITGNTLGGSNSYRDTKKDLSLGEIILQTQDPLLKAMLVSSSEDLDFIKSARLSQQAYVAYKNKFVKRANELINDGFMELDNFNQTVGLDSWVDKVIEDLARSREFYDAFKWSYMSPYGVINDTMNVTLYDSPIYNKLTGSVDYVRDKNDHTTSVLIYWDDIVNSGKRLLLVEGDDYSVIKNDTLLILIHNELIKSTDNVILKVFSDQVPSYIPPTPAKMGCGELHKPEKYVDTSYSTPTEVIRGHDGSITKSYGGLVDDLILELEKRIYSSVIDFFKVDYKQLLTIEKVKPGLFRKTKYSTDEYNEISKSYFLKWAHALKYDYTSNDYYDEGDWKTWNYKLVNPDLPGYWKGMYIHAYDTYTPDTTPWAMLGFSVKPLWWNAEYGDDYSSINVKMWTDIENGNILHGKYQGVNEQYARPGLIDSYLPVNSDGELLAPHEVFANEPNDSERQAQWDYGDGSPVEMAWMHSSEYYYQVLEILYLTRPAEFGEKLWNTFDLFNAPVQDEQVVSSVTYTRRSNGEHSVHGELVDNVNIYNPGYQQFISDRLLFLNKDLTEEFGNKVRTLNVKLGNKVSGFTNNDTLQLFAESSSTASSNTNLLIPSENVNVKVYTSQPLHEYTYSGVIIRALANGHFDVHGYDILNPCFKYYERNEYTNIQSVTVGGETADFSEFKYGKEYVYGEIVRYNKMFYLCKETHTSNIFDTSKWNLLKTLPVTGGISVNYKPNTTGNVVDIKYGHVFDTIQDVYDFLIGYGDYLESEGWLFDELDSDTSVIKNWYASAKEYLFWVSNDWAPNTSVFLNPIADKMKLLVKEGYPGNIEQVSNGVYSIIDRNGYSVNPRDTIIERDGRNLSVSMDSDSNGIYALRVRTYETEHIITVDNITEFNDTIYDPLLMSRQKRLRYNGVRTSGWIGKYEAPGYIINGDEIVGNYENLTNSIRLYNDLEEPIDNTDMRDLARHNYGFVAKDYLSALDISDLSQFKFYQGMVQQKGTLDSITKLLRSSSFDVSENPLEVFEEMAFKVGEYGGYSENLLFEFLIDAGRPKFNPQAVTLEYPSSQYGVVTNVEIINATDIYMYGDPIVYVSEPENANGKVAEFEIVLNEDRMISDVRIVNSGAGYTNAPKITINKISVVGLEVSSVDVVFTTITKTITYDTLSTETITIDVDDKEHWLYNPKNTFSDDRLIPTIDKIENNPVPNAGYVHMDDVKWTAYSMDDMFALFDAEIYPSDKDTIWVANSTISNENLQSYDWMVYGVNKIIVEDFTVISESHVNDITDEIETTEESIDSLKSLSKEESLVSQRIEIQIKNKEKEVNIKDDKKAADILALNESLQSTLETLVNIKSKIKSLNVYKDSLKTSLYKMKESLGNILVNADNIAINKTIPSSIVDGKVLTGTTLVNNVKTYVEYDMSSNSIMLETNGTVGDDDVVYVIQFEPLRMKETSDVVNNDFTQWVDNYSGDGKWAVINNGEVTRQYAPLVDTSLFDVMFLYNKDTGSTITELYQHDPYKGIIPGFIDRNITYKTDEDPATYNSPDADYISRSILYGKDNIGEVWWDTDKAKTYLYEQGDETYRKNNWGLYFPGSEIVMYEWVSSEVVPSQYTGDGVPKDTNNYVIEESFNEYDGVNTVVYYFWVRSKTTYPEYLENRTMTVTNMEAILASPSDYGYQWFTFVSDKTFIMSNINHYAKSSDVVVQLRYKLNHSLTNTHKEWALLRDSDEESSIPDFLWNKMVDSITEFLILEDTSGKITSTASNFDEFISNAKDTYPGIRMINYNDKLYATVPVPATNLSDNERYGISIRPMQTMFKDIFNARKVLVQSMNELLLDVNIYDNNANWDKNVDSDTYWAYIDWYKSGYDESNTIPVIQVENISDLSEIEDELNVGDIIKVLNGGGNRHSVYIYSINQEFNTTEYEIIKRERASMQLLDAVYSDDSTFKLNVELRQIIEAAKEYIFVDDYEVNVNKLFFSLVNYVLQEQSSVDWVFKTSYLKATQEKQGLAQTSSYKQGNTSAITEYITETKPYHSKLRSFSTKYTEYLDFADGTAIDSYNTTVNMVFDRVSCTMTVDELRLMLSVSNPYDTISVIHDLEVLENGTVVVIPDNELSNDPTIITYNFGAAARYSKMHRQSVPNLQTFVVTNPSRLKLSQFSTLVTPVTVDELDDYNNFLDLYRERMDCGLYRGDVVDGGEFGKLYTEMWDSTPWDSTKWEEIDNPVYISPVPRDAMSEDDPAYHDFQYKIKPIYEGEINREPSVDEMRLGMFKPFDDVIENGNSLSVVVINDTEYESNIIFDSNGYLWFTIASDPVKGYAYGPKVGDKISVYEYRPTDGGRFIQPYENGVPEELVPIVANESIILTGDTYNDHDPKTVVYPGDDSGWDSTVDYDELFTVNGLNNWDERPYDQSLEDATYSNKYFVFSSLINASLVVKIYDNIDAYENPDNGEVSGTPNYRELTENIDYSLTPIDDVTDVEQFKLQYGDFIMEELGIDRIVAWNVARWNKTKWDVDNIEKYISDFQKLVFTEEHEYTNVITMEYTFPNVSFKIFYNDSGTVEYQRNSDMHSSVLVSDLHYGDTEAIVADVTNLPPATNDSPGVVWIDGERIEYTKKRSNKLYGLNRGTKGTSIPISHESGIKVFDGSDRQNLPSPNDYIWNNSISGLAGANTVQGLFLQKFPGTFTNERPYK